MLVDSKTNLNKDSLPFSKDQHNKSLESKQDVLLCPAYTQMIERLDVRNGVDKTQQEKDSKTTCHVGHREASNMEFKRGFVSKTQNNNELESTKNTDKTPQEENSKERDSQNADSKDGKIKTLTRSANDLSLGISMIVAVLLGLGIGYLLYKWLGYYWLIWVGLGYGVAAAILNVVKAYKRLYKDLDSLKHEEKYKYMQDRILEKREKEAMQRKEKKDM